MIEQNIHINIRDHIHIGSRYHCHWRRSRKHIFRLGPDIDVALHSRWGLPIIAGHFHPIPFFHRNLPPFSVIGIPTIFQMPFNHFPFATFGLVARSGNGRAARIPGGGWSWRRIDHYGRLGRSGGRRRSIIRVTLHHLRLDYINRRSHVNGSRSDQIASQQSSPEA
jgi:hypothetical protein